MRVGRIYSGFTIVELLIVIVVIGILSTLVIVAYSGIQNRANNATAQATLRDNFGKIHQYYITESEYPKTQAALESLDLKIQQNVFDISANNSFLYCYYDNNAMAVLIGRVVGSGTEYVYGPDGLREMPSWGANIQERCNIGFGGSGAGFTGKGSVLGMDNGTPHQWRLWTHK